MEVTPQTINTDMSKTVTLNFCSPLYVHIQTAPKNTESVGCFHANSLHDKQTLIHQIKLLVANFCHFELEVFTVALLKNALIDTRHDACQYYAVCRLPPRFYPSSCSHGDLGQSLGTTTYNLKTSVWSDLRF